MNINTVAIGELDVVAEKAGGYVDFCPATDAKYGIDVVALKVYCKKNGKDPLDLTARERNMFIVEKAEGIVTEPLLGIGILYDYRKISRYSKERGITPADLTIRELQRFAVI